MTVVWILAGGMGLCLLIAAVSYLFGHLFMEEMHGTIYGCVWFFGACIFGLALLLYLAAFGAPIALSK